MRTEAPLWHRKSACLGLCRGEPCPFFTAICDDGKVKQRADGTRPLDEVRASFCGQCPVRRDCLSAAVIEECGAAAANRFGVSGGLTPAQRYSIEKRGTLQCPECSTTFDPFGHLEGWLVCDNCGFELTTEPLPEEGDGWMDRHTELAKIVVAWVVENLRAGEHGPTPNTLAMILDARPGDVKRVYAALVQDGTLVANGEIYARSTRRLAAPWQPPHLVSQAGSMLGSRSN